MALSRQYGVDRLLQPIFDFVPTADSPPPAPKHVTAAPTRPRQKRGANAAGVDDDDAPPPKIGRPKGSGRGKRLPPGKRAIEDTSMNMETMFDPSLREDASEMSQPLEEDYESEDESGYVSEGADENLRSSSSAPSRKRKQEDSSFASAPAPMASTMSASGPLKYARMILDYFVSESTSVPQFLIEPPSDFDANVVIDDDGHTALHWACAMGRIRIVRLLLNAGADIFRANSMGQTALMRSVMFTNNYDLRKFPELFELLHRSTINIDRNDRTVFHYIVDIALQKGKTHAARYYIETVLERLADYPKEVADILNFQDEEGETALTLAARARSKRLVKILLDHGADPKVANRDGKTAEDYILEDEKFRENDVNAGISSTGAAPQLTSQTSAHVSQLAQQISTKSTTDAAQVIESLAASFDAHLNEQSKLLDHAQSSLQSLHQQCEESQIVSTQLQEQIDAHEQQLEATEARLLDQLKHRMGQRFRLGWEKWIRDEDGREQHYDAADRPGDCPDLDEMIALAATPAPEAQRQAQLLREDLDHLRQRRTALFEQFAKMQSERQTLRKTAQYKQLVSAACGIAHNDTATLDSVIQQLCAQ